MGTRFFRPGLAQDNRIRPGESRRRRERHRALELQRENAVALRAEADELPSLSFDWWGSDGRILASEPCEARPHSTEPTDGALRIVSGCTYDPGNAAYRHHTAINECTKHASAFVRFGHTNPFCDLRQIDGGEPSLRRRSFVRDARAAVYTADVIHAHVDYSLQAFTGFKWRARPDQLVVRHYHGSRPKGTQWPTLNMMEDDLANVVLVGARLTLVEIRPSRMAWLPIAIPTHRYRALVPKDRPSGRPFRIAHSPTRADYKGSADLVAAVGALRYKGLKVDLVMIEKQQHGDALRLKADADLTFDSFWLGIQGSGLEAAAMGQMVVAGDESVKALYEKSEVGHCPYTFAKDRAQLTEVLERAITDPQWRTAEAKRVGAYVTKYHDYAAVARRYEGIIANASGWANVATQKTRKVKHVAA